MSGPSRLKGLSTFRARIFWSLVPVILLLFVLLGLIDLYKQKRLAEEEFVKRGQAMAANLAYSSELGVFAEDRRLLESSIRAVAADADVAYVFIYGESWKILANEGSQVSNVKGRTWELSDEERSRLLRDPQIFSKIVKARGDPATQNIPAIAVTASAMPGDIQRIRDAGFDIYQTKPIRVKEFTEAVQKLLDARKGA